MEFLIFKKFYSWMNRRTTLKLLASSSLGYGYTLGLHSSAVFTAGTHSAAVLEAFSKHVLGAYYENPLSDEAKGMFLHCFIQQCWREEDQKLYWDTTTAFQNYCKRKYQRTFESIPFQEQETLLSDLFDPKKNLFEGSTEWALLTRDLVLFEFFSGQKGATEVLRHLPIPGRYEGQIPLSPEDTAFRH